MRRKINPRFRREFQPTPTNLSPFPASNKGVEIVAQDLEDFFASGKSYEEIAKFYGILKDSLRHKIRNSLSLTEAVNRGVARFNEANGHAPKDAA